MLLRSFVAVALTSFAGTAIAADAGRPVVYPTAPVATPGPVLAGDLSLAVGGLFYEGYSLWGTFNVLGRVNKPLNDNLNLEVEGGGAAEFFSGGSSQPAYEEAVAHLWGMHSPTAALGLFGGAIFSYGPITWLGGVEAKHFLTNGSWAVSAAAMRVCCTTTVGAFTASYNHYFNPNHRIGIRAAVLTDFSYSSWELSADVEHRFMHPISLFAEASLFGEDGSGGYWTAKGGVRFFLDGFGDTLQSHEKKVPWTTWVSPEYVFAR